MTLAPMSTKRIASVFKTDAALRDGIADFDRHRDSDFYGAARYIGFVEL